MVGLKFGDGAWKLVEGNPIEASYGRIEIRIATSNKGARHEIEASYGRIEM